ncbi:MAG: TfoX/Sxy family protein [Nitrospira sp.]|nr:TfoX/Sxy family protein [bacterium]MBL7049083.1 TfoX/Sxy family protein [Nitrospira sp.]
MKKTSEFIEFLEEVFEKFGIIDIKKMFGGYGVYHEGLMFGLVERNTLYLKADIKTKELFESMELSQFSYRRKDKTIKMSFYRAPEEIFDDKNLAVKWADLAYGSAFRSASSGKNQTSRKP